VGPVVGINGGRPPEDFDNFLKKELSGGLSIVVFNCLCPSKSQLVHYQNAVFAVGPCTHWVERAQVINANHIERLQMQDRLLELRGLLRSEVLTVLTGSAEHRGVFCPRWPVKLADQLLERDGIRKVSVTVVGVRQYIVDSIWKDAPALTTIPLNIGQPRC
jgi:hypothetical protein